MRVGIVDVGSNTVRLLVSQDGEAICRRRAMLALGAAVEEFGAIPEAKLQEVAGYVGTYVSTARKKGVERIEVLVTSPGRQARNADELLARLESAARAPVRVLSADDEARLAFDGAVASMRGLGDTLIAVCDVGGGSAQVAVGTRRDGVAWVRSIDLGSRRLTNRLLRGDPPGREAVERARAEVERYLNGFVPPLPHVALAVGGSSRAVRGLVGPSLDGPHLAAAVDWLAETSTGELVYAFGVDPARAPTLTAGLLILAALQIRLRVALQIARGGLREAAAAELQSRRAAA